MTPIHVKNVTTVNIERVVELILIDKNTRLMMMINPAEVSPSVENSRMSQYRTIKVHYLILFDVTLFSTVVTRVLPTRLLPIFLSERFQD